MGAVAVPAERPVEERAEGFGEHPVGFGDGCALVVEVGDERGARADEPARDDFPGSILRP